MHRATWKCVGALRPLNLQHGTAGGSFGDVLRFFCWQKSSKIIKNPKYFLCPHSYTRFGGPMFLTFNANVVVGVLRLCPHVCDSIPYLSLLFI
jgi:hypothetical protein